VTLVRLARQILLLKRRASEGLQVVLLLVRLYQGFAGRGALRVVVALTRMALVLLTAAEE
jgi:hypothetical protein